MLTNVTVVDDDTNSTLKAYNLPIGVIQWRILPSIPLHPVLRQHIQFTSLSENHLTIKITDRHDAALTTLIKLSYRNSVTI